MKKQSVKVDIIAVAKAAGVSAATVSRVMNHPDLVNPSTRKKVDNAIRRTGYIRNRAAQTMHGRRSATIGLVVPTVTYSIFADLVQSFNDTVAELGFTVLLATHGYDLKVEYQVLRKLLEHRVDGIALVGLDHSADTYRLLASRDVPVVALWNYSEDSPIPCMGSDNSEAGRIAAQHLVALGHRAIGFIFPPTAENDRARNRRDAALQVVEAAGIVVPDEWSVQSLYSIAHAKTACLGLLRRKYPLTALICGNDIIAQGAVSAALELGLSIPQDLSIIGIGDFAGAGDLFPALSTVRIPAYEIGRQAGRHLVQRVAETAELPFLRTRFEVSLIQRATTAASPAIRCNTAPGAQDIGNQGGCVR
ncbi:LacI family DNA-binding transcriptional regulator [Oceaniovalibus sp. ACAM 378]|uniref:LacI family DNA-binding transcriptional regulator n=1 Tax=Oceaniovalibus sp. ACAM 378 TaxID=2599923 RepID=UPI0011D8ABB4|nr:LacI family DNA-binding transcriptional regulator [Oceaniovalibus sp. ACAM 378]TYB83614.1 substrate-binding domain-containing protein [Oceaniovalibus sp. ACAM 378]